MIDQSTICAISTAPGNGAIAIVRLSGENAISICEKVFHPVKTKSLNEQKANTVHFGTIQEGDEIIDEVLVSLFKAPHSYTGENSIEIACHGAPFIQHRILQVLIKNGARTANPGEFTQRAFLNGKMDLSQAEAVADLIASNSAAAHKVALQQMRGGFSSEIANLRGRLLNFISLVELELDFGEEDVEFADRTQLNNLVNEIKSLIEKLVNSFELGNVIKNGVPVAIVGNTNVGKSTLLNALLNEDRAIVSDIEGTTRDVIEDTINLGGITFRFIDTNHKVLSITVYGSVNRSNRFVYLINIFVGIYQKHYNLCLLHLAIGTFNTHTFDSILSGSYTCRIDKSEGDSSKVNGILNHISGGSLNIRNNGSVFV